MLYRPGIIFTIYLYILHIQLCIGIFPIRSTIDTQNNQESTGHVHSFNTSQDIKNIQEIDFISCRKYNLPNIQLSFQFPMDNGDALFRSPFTGFYEAFFHAYDTLLAMENDTSSEPFACEFQNLQEVFLKNATTLDKLSTGTKFITLETQREPMLVQFVTTSEDIECTRDIHDIWSAEYEAFTPFLTVKGRENTHCTTLLLHITQSIATKILDLPCVARVLELPAILKLTPFARSSVSILRQPVEKQQELLGPALQIQLVPQKIDTIANMAANVHTTWLRLQHKIQLATGLTNILQILTENDVASILAQNEDYTMARVFLYSKAVEDFQTWTKIVAILIEESNVEWVDLHTTLQLAQHNLRRNPIIQRRLDPYVADIVGVSNVAEHGIQGKDIIVGITDTGLELTHNQFAQKESDIFNTPDLDARKVILYYGYANNTQDESKKITCGHGTHVAGIVAGSSQDGTSKDIGIAPKARIAFMDIGKQSPDCRGMLGCPVTLDTPSDVSLLLGKQMDVGARIFSYSWGTGDSEYNSQSMDIDNFIYLHPEILIVVAAGNTGDEGPGTISCPSDAKNVLSVGASLNSKESFGEHLCPEVLNENAVASFSSIGPTADGRQKPDLVAPGMNIESAMSEGSDVDTCKLDGTSQATPVVAGMAVLLYEWLRDGWWYNGMKNMDYGMKYIPAALLKALLIHSSERMNHRVAKIAENTSFSCEDAINNMKPLEMYPGIEQGYGKPTLRNIIAFSNANNTAPSDKASGLLYFYPNSSSHSEPSVKHGESIGFQFGLRRNLDFRATIVWTDPAGAMTGRSMLQNDLDLSVRILYTSKDGIRSRLKKPVFYPLSGNGSADHINNVEMVEVKYTEIIETMENLNIKIPEDGTVYVEAVVHGYSVLAGKGPINGQAFALVASTPPSTMATFSKASDNSTSSFISMFAIAIVFICLVIALVVLRNVHRKKKLVELEKSRY